MPGKTTLVFILITHLQMGRQKQLSAIRLTQTGQKIQKLGELDIIAQCTYCNLKVTFSLQAFRSPRFLLRWLVIRWLWHWEASLLRRIRCLT